MPKSIHIFRGKSIGSATVHKLKAGITLDEYRKKHANDFPIIIQVYPPSIEELQDMIHNCTCEAVDGCEGIEPDGYCCHGYPSWPLALGYI